MPGFTLRSRSWYVTWSSGEVSEGSFAPSPTASGWLAGWLTGDQQGLSLLYVDQQGLLLAYLRYTPS